MLHEVEEGSQRNQHLAHLLPGPGRRIASGFDPSQCRVASLYWLHCCHHDRPKSLHARNDASSHWLFYAHFGAFPKLPLEAQGKAVLSNSGFDKPIRTLLTLLPPLIGLRATTSLRKEDNTHLLVFRP